MLDVRLFRQGSFGGAVLVNLFSVIALVGFLYFVSQHLQLIAGLSPVAAGLALLPGLVAMIVGRSRRRADRPSGAPSRSSCPWRWACRRPGTS